MSAPTISTGRTWTNGDTVTPSRVNQTVNSATLNFTQTDVLAGRSTAGAGVAEEIPCTGTGRAIIAATTEANARVAVGLGPNVGRVALNQGATALADAATIATDCSLNNVFKVTLGGNRALGAPANPVEGSTYMWIIRQDGTGSRTLAYNAIFKFPGGTAPVLTTSASAVDVLSAYYDGTSFLAALVKGFA